MNIDQTSKTDISKVLYVAIMIAVYTIATLS